MKGKSDFDFFPPELAEKFYADEKKIIETGQPVINQEQYKSKPGDKSGKKYWSVTTKVLWHDAEGKVLGTVGITRDTTEQKRTEAKLAYEQQLFQTLLETTPDNIYFKDRESRFVRVSQAKAESTMQIVRKAYRVAHPNDKPERLASSSGRGQAIHRMVDRQDRFRHFPGGACPHGFGGRAGNHLHGPAHALANSKE